MPTVLMLGGSSVHPGGVEAFCARSTAALNRYAPRWRVDHIATESAYLRPATLGPFLRGVRALVRRRRDRPDCVWLQYANLPDLGFILIARALGMRVMVTPHLGSNWRSQDNRILKRLSKWALAGAHRLALISPTQAVELPLPPGPPRSLIRNFLTEEILNAPLPDASAEPSGLELIHSGRLSVGKGSDLVIRAAALLRDMGVAFRLRLTGSTDASFDAHLHDMVRQYGLEDRVSLLGRVPERELLDHLRAADVLIHPSRIDSYPLIVLEATACATVPVCMELAGARDMVETYGGHIVSQGDAVAEIAAWLKAQSPSALRLQARAAAAEVRMDYAWERCADALARALDACVAGDTAATEPSDRASMPAAQERPTRDQTIGSSVDWSRSQL